MRTASTLRFSPQQSPFRLELVVENPLSAASARVPTSWVGQPTLCGGCCRFAGRHQRAGNPFRSGRLNRRNERSRVAAVALARHTESQVRRHGLSKTSRTSRGGRAELRAQGPIAGKVLGPVNLSLGVKVLIVVICALTSVIVGAVAGYLSHEPGARHRHAVLFEGGVFIGVMTLCLTVLGSLGLLSTDAA